MQQNDGNANRHPGPNGTPHDGGTQGNGAPADELAAFDAVFGVIAFTCNRHIIDHMLRFNRHFNLDYQTMVIWGVLAHQNVAHLIPMRAGPDSYIDLDGQVIDVGQSMRPVRVRDLVHITGIPKETVRRKLDQLKAEEWIVQVDGGWVIRHDHKRGELRDFTRESVKRLIGASDHMRRILKNANP